jgi:4,5-DOPA dioxygenase extradiol
MALTPTFFFGHGSPMLTLSKNVYTDAWRAVGQALSLPATKPRAVVCISAHWYTISTGVMVNTAPETIHDFGGFPQALFDIRYPAPGDPILARRIQKLLQPVPVALSTDWGFDHGTWTVLRHVFPNADVPVVQLSIDAHLPAAMHFQIGQRLAELREEGVLLIGSGNVVHNLREYVRNQPDMPPFDWNKAFDLRVRQLLHAGDYQPLIAYEKLGIEARRAVPTPDHYLPLLYVLGSSVKADHLSFPTGGFDGGSMSMMSVRLG